MAKQRETYLTFSVTVPQPKGMTIPQVRSFIVEALTAYDPDMKIADAAKIKCHLTNKEVKYGA